MEVINISPAYLAGVIDSDGSITISRRHTNRPNINYCVIIQLTWTISTDTEKLMNYLVHKYGSSYFKEKIVSQSHRFKRSKPIIKYCAVSKAAEKILLDIYEHLFLKKKQALLALEMRHNQKIYKKNRPLKISQLYEKIYLLNKSLNSKNKKKRKK